MNTKTIIVTPKNSKLAYCKDIALAYCKDKSIDTSELLEVRGEDVPLFIENMIKEKNKALGVTGEDLFREYQLDNPNTQLSILKKVEWTDKKSLFGKPALCLLGPKGKKLSDLPKKLKICISSKYKTISKRYLNNLETEGYDFEKIYVSGSAEETFSKGIVDLVIDIVYTGDSAKNAGLEVYETLFLSDFVVIGKIAIPIKKYFSENLGDEQKERILRRYRFKLEKIKEQVKPIIEDVIKKGDEALIEITKKFEGRDISRNNLRVSEEEIKEAYNKVSKEVLAAIKKQIEYSKRFHEKQVRESWKFENEKGVLIGEVYNPIDSVGLYVPGGQAPYPTVMQILAIPAKIAGVKRIVACTPNALPEVLVAADLSGVDEVYRIGGAQAIAAMAYGTETIKKVNKIVGPGNVYVTAAKILVSEDVAIDMPAGPSEALIIADKNANPAFLAADMLARCEHDEDATAVLVTLSEEQADEVIEEIEKQKKQLSREGTIDVALSRYSAIIIAKSIDESIEFANEYAPEHLELMVENPLELLNKIRNAGSIFLGYYAPVAIGDYASGVNHVLPTSQYAKVFSPIGVETFMKRSEFECLTKEGLNILNENVVKYIAAVEKFDAHAKSVSIRLEDKKENSKRGNQK